MLRTLTDVLARPGYALLALLVALSVFVFAVLLPNIPLITTVFADAGIPLAEKLALLLSLLGSISTNFTPVSASYTIAIAILFGLNTSLLLYYVRRVQRASGSLAGVSSAGLGGLLSGLLGVGCAACGTFILSSLLALIGAGGILSYLPFGGEEFGLAGVVLLLFATYALVKKIEAPLVC